MKMVEIESYTFKELSEKAKQKAKNYFLNDGCSYWSEFVVEDWKHKMHEKGINLEEKEIYWSVFGLQDSGASFTGPIDLPKFMLAHELVGTYLPNYVEFVSGGDVWAKLVRCALNSQHVHSMTVRVDSEGLDDSFVRDIQNICREYMNEMYRDLEKAYEYHTSDEAISNDCDDNNFIFNIRGEII